MVNRFFLGVGAQKAGTTWLHDQLALHPEVEVPRRKEVHYFDSVTIPRGGRPFTTRHLSAIKKAIRLERWTRAERTIEVLELIEDGPDAYVDYLRREATDRTRVVGEITPAYATLTREGFEFAHKVLDGPRVIFLMRDPVARYWSSLRMSFKDGDEAAERFTGNSVDGFMTFERDNYDETVQLLDTVFGDDVLYLFYESLFTEESLHRIAAHLEVSPVWEWDLSRRSNAGVDRTRPEISDALAERLAGQYRFVRERFGDLVPDSWLDLG